MLRACSEAVCTAGLTPMEQLQSAEGRPKQTLNRSVVQSVAGIHHGGGCTGFGTWCPMSSSTTTCPSPSLLEACLESAFRACLHGAHHSTVLCCPALPAHAPSRDPHRPSLLLTTHHSFTDPHLLVGCTLLSHLSTLPKPRPFSLLSLQPATGPQIHYVQEEGNVPGRVICTDSHTPTSPSDKHAYPGLSVFAAGADTNNSILTSCFSHLNTRSSAFAIQYGLWLLTLPIYPTGHAHALSCPCLSYTLHRTSPTPAHSFQDDFHHGRLRSPCISAESSALQWEP